MSVTIRRSEQPPWTVLSVGGELDVVGAPDMRQAVVTAVAEGSRLLALDLSELDFVDSFGLGAVVGALKRVRQRGGELALVCPSSRIRRVFEICDLDRILALHDSIDTLSELSAVVSDGAASTRRRP
ncbi:MAG: STAS domain-containing protein [Acidimicrobiaceae bacterium]|nr:STAS domain-containing protein [Acidimicrobiaceae bacterium]MDE0514938.1 STAS domain-containing protein [Acidimicrobiaceae bacterium]MDE0657563.1 STAS domain-containing protein [Acidimicrobiaceae bacterium]MXZ94383.1 STAS domain-containing protein [Acidimicrobiaceae bacterium]MYF43914.1 STAS domain-containing protein [Acidimicrobiaceae bacterium]